MKALLDVAAPVALDGGSGWLLAIIVLVVVVACIVVFVSVNRKKAKKNACETTAENVKEESSNEQ